MPTPTPSDDTRLQKWADPAMFRSESHDASTGPKVHLLSMNADPLGDIAACAKMYLGEVVRDLSEITDEERRHYLVEIQKTILAMPLEAVNFHFLIENVTRAFTHQLVRQRTAAYAQESMRFAVVEDMTEAVALPPSLARFNNPEDAEAAWKAFDMGLALADDENQYIEWCKAVGTISATYNQLVNSGMPAEDARGLMPTNIVTRVHYLTDLRALLSHSGVRLCTQAQFEWRLVFAQIAQSIAQYRRGERNEMEKYSYGALSQLFRPICYQKGSCQFGADFDRKCSIRGRVDANADHGVSPQDWGEDHYGNPAGAEPVFIGAIGYREWAADPAAAR